MISVPKDTVNHFLSKKLMAILKGKDAILKEARDCVNRNDQERLKDISPYIYSYWCVICVEHGCLCIDEQIAIPKAIKYAVLEDVHSTYPGSPTVISLAQEIWWPYINRDMLAKASECKTCSEIGKKKGDYAYWRIVLNRMTKIK